MLVALCIASFIVGVVVTLFIQTFIIRRRLLSIAVEPIVHKPQFVPYALPKELLALISDPDQKGQKESCVALNLIIQFLFRELRDSNRVRRWVTKKMNIEFNEMLQSTTGKLIDKITLRDFNLGSTFPVINCVAVDTVKLQQDESIEELDIMADLDYKGGFQIAVEIDLVFKKWAYLSVTITKLKGIGRLQFTRKPYTHWSFTFYEDPEVEFEVESKFGGRPVPQVTSLIISQIKRILRKRHTLPHYKMRYKPFFSLPEELIYQKDLSVKGNLIGQGQLEVKVIGCSRLLVEPADHFLFCTLSVDKLRWLEYEELRKKVWVVYEVKIIKGTAQSIGLSFKEDFMLEKYEDVVVVDNVVPDSPAAVTDIRKGDVLVSVGMTRITSVTQAAKILRNVNDRVTLRLERAKTGTDELVKDSEASKQKEVVRDDFVNIVIKPCESDEKLKETGSTPSSNQINPDKNISASNPSSPHRKVLSLVNTGKALLQRRVKSNTVSEGSGTTISQSDGSLPRSPSGHRISRSMDSRQLINSMNVQTVSGDQSLSPPKMTKSAELIRNRNNSDPGFVLVTSREASDVSSDEDDDLDHNNQQQEVKPVPPDGSSSKSEDVEKPNLNDMQRTSEVRSKVNPEWNEDFIFNTSSDDKYLNVCVWCRIPPKLDKHEKVTKPGRESLIGHISLPLSDITLDCLMTIQRDSQRSVKLVPSENIAGVSRAKFQEYMGHIGFDHRMCHGDITLGFKYDSTKTSDSERTVPVVTVISDKESSEEVVSLADSEGVDEKIRLEIGKHDFTAKQFHSATYCHFCGKKIWLKDAFQCYTCAMICHKKCVVRCQTQTLCTKGGAMMRSNPSEKWKPPITESRRRQVQRSGPAAILSKFRKDGNLESKLEVSQLASCAHSPQASPKPSPQPSPKFVRRRNSAPGTDDIISGTFLDVTNIPQTRSSTSLQALLNTGALPRRLSEELFGNKYKGDSSDDSDSESSSILQLSKHRAKGQNLDEMVVTAAKEMGRELYAELSLEERKQKLDAMVSKFQKEIDIESENKTEMIKEEMETVDQSQKEALLIKISKSDEKVEALMMMMLHYCAGLQYCLDQEEEERRKVKDGNEQIKGIETDLNVLSEQTIEVRKLTDKIHRDSVQKQTELISRELSDSIESSSSDSCDLVLVRGDRTSIDENPEIQYGREEAVYHYTDRDVIKEEKHHKDTHF